MSSAKLPYVRRQIEQHLSQIQTLFRSGCYVTFIMRMPGFPEQDMLITNDPSLDELAALIERSKARPEA